MKKILGFIALILIAQTSLADSLTALSKAEQYLEVNPRLLKFTTKAKTHYANFFNENFDEIVSANKGFAQRINGCTKEELLTHIDTFADDITEGSREFAIEEINKNFTDEELYEIRGFYLSPTALKLKIYRDKGLIGDDENSEKISELLTDEDKEVLLDYKSSDLGKKEEAFLENTLTSESVAEVLKRKEIFSEEKIKCAKKEK